MNTLTAAAGLPGGAACANAANKVAPQSAAKGRIPMLSPFYGAAFIALLHFPPQSKLTKTPPI
jgi:hypothetical protein